MDKSPNDLPLRESLPLDDVMLAMDVVDTLRHQQDLVERELTGDNREGQLIGKLRDIYRQQGIDVPDRILREGVAALAESRFVYTPPSGGAGVFFARLYVTREKWGKWVIGAFVAAIFGLMTYNFGYVPFTNAQIEAARVELAEGLPARMDELYQTIFTETKIQTAAVRADEIRKRGKIAAAEGDRTRAENAIAQLEEMLATLRRDYTLRVVNREDQQSGFWTFPEINTDATNYYIVVEAIDSNSKAALELPVLNEENGEVETVNIWGIRVPEEVYRAVAADKRDDGIIQRNIVGLKQYGFLEVDYVVPVLGGAVTRW